MPNPTPIPPELLSLRRQYFSLYPPSQLSLPSSTSSLLAKHQAYLISHLLEERYPQPEEGYQRKFWKVIVGRLEEELGGEEAGREEWVLEDKIAEHYNRLITSPASSSTDTTPPPSYKTYIYNVPGEIEEKSITLIESQSTIEAGSTGLRTWTAGFHLATQLLSSRPSPYSPSASFHPSLLTHPSPSPEISSHPPPPQSTSSTTSAPAILELGSGTGFLSVFLGQNGVGREVWASDLPSPAEVQGQGLSQGGGRESGAAQEGTAEVQEKPDVGKSVAGEGFGAAQELTNQVGGHKGVMSDSSGSLIMKPALPREIAFYQLLSSTPHPINTPVPTTTATSSSGSKYENSSQRQLLGELKRFLPRFYGTLRMEGQVAGGQEGSGGAEGETPESIVLSNLSYPYSRPSILDIKLGTILYDEDATPEKKARMIVKAKQGTTWEMGMRMTGFQTWDVEKRKIISTPKAYGYALTRARLPESFVRFFCLPGENEIGQEHLEAKEGSNVETTDVGAAAAAAAAAASAAAESKPTQGQQAPVRRLSVAELKQYKRNMLRVLVGVRAAVDKLIDIFNVLEIRFVGASILILYEADPAKLQKAWDAVDASGSGDGLANLDMDLDDESDFDEDSDSEDERQVEQHGTPKAKKGFFGGAIGGFGANKQSGGSGFGLLDASPKRPSKRLPTPSGRSDSGRTNDSAGEDDDTETTPRPFTIRMIDFAHTSLVPGEGRDEGVVKGLRTTRALLDGRIAELAQDMEDGPLELLRSNLLINQASLPRPIQALPISWLDAVNSAGSSDPQAAQRHDELAKIAGNLPEDLVVVATDVIYDPELVSPLVATLKLFLSRSPKRFAVIAATIRNSDTVQLFESSISESALKLEVVQPHDLHETAQIFWNASTWEGQDVRIMKIWS